MSNPNAIEVKAKFGASEDNGVSWAKLEYYMEANPRQKEWRKVPGVVAAASKDEAMRKAEELAKELSDLDIQELTPATRDLFAAKRMFRRLEDVDVQELK